MGARHRRAYQGTSRSLRSYINARLAAVLTVIIVAGSVQFATPARAVPAPTPSGSITGIVTSALDGTPISGVTVRATGYLYFASAVTDATGAYTVDDLVPDTTYRVTAETPDGSYLIAESYPDAITVVDQSVTTGVDLAMRTGGAITGTVSADDGSGPIAGAPVLLCPPGEACYYQNRRTVTAADGSFAFWGVPSGTWTAEISAPDGSGFLGEGYNDVWDYSYPSTPYTYFTVSPGTTTANIDVGLARAASISGRVTSAATYSDMSAPVSGVWVSVNIGLGSTGVFTSADGTYRIDGLRHGTYKVRFTPGDSFEPKYYDDAVNAETATELLLSDGEAVSGIDASLSSATSADVSLRLAGEASYTPTAIARTGSIVTYLAYLTNTGPLTASNVQLRLTLPAGTHFASGSIRSFWSYGDIGSCTAVDSQVTCSLPALAKYSYSGTYARISIQLPTDPGTVSIPFEVSADQPDPELGNNTGTIVTEVVPELTDVYTNGQFSRTLQPSTQRTFTNYVGNSGPDVASAVEISVDVTPGIDYVGVTPTEATWQKYANSYWSMTPTLVGSGSCDLGPAGSDHLATCYIGDLAPSEYVYVRTRLLPSASAESFRYTTTATTPTRDGFADNNYWTTSVTVAATHADLATDYLPQTQTHATAGVGSSNTYLTWITSAGPDMAAETTVVDTAPAGSTITSAYWSEYGGYARYACAIDGATATCEVGSNYIGSGDLYPGSLIGVYVTVTLPSSPGTVTNRVSVSSATPDPNPANDVSELATTVVPDEADLSFYGHYASDYQPVVGQEVTFTAYAMNGGRDEARAVVITDRIPDGTTFVRARVYNYSTGQWTDCSEADGLVTCNAGDAYVAYSAGPIEVTVRVGNTPGPITNHVEVTSDTTDPFLDNNSSDVTITVGNVADLVVDQFTTEVVADGDGRSVHSESTITNAGPSPAGNVRIVQRPVARAYTCRSTAYNWIDATQGAAHSLGDDGSTEVGLPFTLDSDGRTIDRLTISANGYIGFGSTNGSVYSPPEIPNPSSPNGIVAAFWDDLLNGTVFTTTVGTAPNRTFVVEWKDTGHYGFGGAVTFEIQLRESTGYAELHYQDTVFGSSSYDHGASATGGVESMAGDLGFQIWRNQPVLDDSTAYRCSYGGRGTAGGATYSSGTWRNTSTGDTGACVADGDELQCAVGTLNVDEAIEVTADGQLPPEGGRYEFVATVESDATDPDPSSNVASSDITVSHGADLAVSTHSASSGAVLFGREVTFTAAITNETAEATTGVLVTDRIPDGTTFVRARAYRPSTGQWNDCTENDGLVICDVGDTGAVSRVATIEVTVRVGNTPGPITNHVEVTSDTTDTDPTNNSSDVTITVVPDVADLTVGCWNGWYCGNHYASDSQPVVGHEVTFTAYAVNAGRDEARAVVITDRIPDGSTYVRARAYNYSTGQWTDCSEADGLVTCNAGDAYVAHSAGPIEVTVRVGNTPGPITNHVEVSSDTTDPDPTNNSSDATITVVPDVADLSFYGSQGASDGQPVVGHEVTFTAYAWNGGTASASNVVITDRIPDGTTFVRARVYNYRTGQWTDCSEADGLVTCNVGDASRYYNAGYIEVTVRVGNTPGPITNRVEVTSDTTDPDPTNNSSDATITVVGDVADLAVAGHWQSDPQPVVGTEVTYGANFSNLGTADASNVVITDRIPAGSTFVRARAYNYSTGQWTDCTEADGLVTCNVGDAARYYNAGQIEVTVRVGNTPGPITNHVEVTSDTTDPDPTNNSSDATITVVADVADLTFGCWNGWSCGNHYVSDSQPVVGHEVTFTANAVNGGTASASNVVITDRIPDGTTFVSARVYNYSTYQWTDCSEADGLVTCNVGDSSRYYYAGQIEVTVRVGNTPGPITNRVEVTSDTTDPDPTNNSSDATITVVGDVADLAVAGHWQSDPQPVVGTEVTYGANFSNLGTADASNVVITDRIPAGSTFVRARAYNYSTGQWTDCTEADGLVTCNVGDAARYYNAGQIEVTVRVGNTPGPITNHVEVTSDTTDPDPTNNSNEVSTTSVPDVADLQVVGQWQSDPHPVVGTENTYRGYVYNAGTAPATNVVVTDSIPAGSTLIAATWRNSYSGQSGTCATGDSVVSCNVGSVPRGSYAWNVEATVTVRMPDQGTSATNIMTVTADQPDPNPGNNASSLQTTIEADRVDLEATVAADPSPSVVGEPTEFTFRYLNHGPSIARDAQLFGTLPGSVDDLTIVAGSDTSACQIVSSAVVCEFGTLPRDSSAWVRVRGVPSAVSPSNGTGGYSPFIAYSDATSTTIEVANQRWANRGGLGFYVVPDHTDLVAGVSMVEHASVGTPTTIHLTATEATYARATNVVITATLPVGFEAFGGNPFSWVSAGGTCTESAGTVRCEFPTVERGQEVAADITVVPVIANNAAEVTVSVSADHPERDLNLDNNSISLFGRSSMRPSATLTLFPSAAVVGQTVVATIGTSDPEGDPLSFRIDWGDGGYQYGPAGAGSFTVSHVYANRGPWTVRVQTSDGGATVSTYSVLRVDPDQPVQADAGPDIVTTARLRLHHGITLDGTASTPTCCISGMTWHLSDGRTFGGAVARDVRFSEPGTYVATLTVTSGPDVSTDSATITVGPEVTDGVQVAVEQEGTNQPIAGGQVLIVDAAGARFEDITADDGIAVLTGVPDGDYTVYVVRGGYKPNETQVTVVGGAARATVHLAVGELAVATLTAERITDPAVLEAAGVDLGAEENNNVYQFEIHLAFESQPIVFTGFVAPSGFYFGGSGGGGWGGGGGGGGGSCYTCYWSVGDTTIAATPVFVGNTPTITYMVIPGKAKWLKEFWDVQLVVSNLGSPSFVLSDGVGQLQLPTGPEGSNPLALPALHGQAQSAIQAMEDIPGGASRSARWIVRGDAEGDWNLSATYAGVLQPSGIPVQLSASVAKPLHVWGGSALKMIVDTDSTAVAGSPYRVRVGLRNVSDVPVFNPSVELLKNGKLNYIYQPRERLEQGTGVIQPGDTFWGDYTLVPAIAGNLRQDLSFVKKTAGNVDLAYEIVPHASTRALSVDAYRYPTRDILDFPEISGATDYRVYATPDLFTDFTDTALPASPVGGAAPGHVRLAVARSAATDSGFYAVSALLDGVPVMRHAVVTATFAETFPTIRVSKECHALDQTATVTVELQDRLFSLTRLRIVSPDGTTSTLNLNGQTARHSFDVTLSDIPADGGIFVLTAQNDAGDSRTREWRLSRNCDLKYAALGDSYTSGEGLIASNDYYPGTDTAANKCHRSSSAYPNLLAHDALHIAAADDGQWDRSSTTDHFAFFSCSGAVTDDIIDHGQHTGSPDAVFGGKPQVDELQSFNATGDPVDVVTFGIGGNDIGFPSIVKECLALPLCFNVGPTTAFAPLAAYNLGARLEETYRRVQDAAPDAEVYVHGYPRLVAPYSTCDFSYPVDVALGGLTQLFHLDAAEATWLYANLIPYLNSVIEAAAARARVRYVDVSNILQGKEICTFGSAANAIRLGDDIAGILGSESFHPNEKGHELYFTKLSQAIRDRIALNSNTSLTPAQPVLAPTPTAVQATVAGATAVYNAGEQIAVSAGNFLADSVVTLTQWSDPTVIGTARADAEGRVTVTGSLVADAPGFHKFVLSGSDHFGDPIVASTVVPIGATVGDFDGDGIPDAADNCRYTANLDQADANDDGIGDACAPSSSGGPAPVPPSVYVDDVAVSEGTGDTSVASIPVRLSHIWTSDVSVRVTPSLTSALAGEVVNAGPRTITVPAGSLSAMYDLGVVADAKPEPARRVTVKVSNPSGGTLADTSAFVTILDDDAPLSIRIGDAQAREGTSPSFNFPVRLSAPVPTGQTVTVSVTTTNGTATGGTDFTAVTGRVLTFAAGEQSAMVSVPVLDDSTAESAETVKAALRPLSRGVALADSTAVGTIIDDERPGPDPNPSAIAEDAAIIEGSSGTSVLRIPVRLSWPTTHQVGVTVEPVVPSALAGDVDSPATTTLSFAPGDTVAWYELRVVGDVIPEKTERVGLKITSAVGATISDLASIISIIDDDAALTITVSDAWAYEGSADSPGTLRFTVALSAPVAPGRQVRTTIACTAATAKLTTDYAACPTDTITFAPGEQAVTIAVPLVGDAIREVNRAMKFSASRTIGATASDSSGVGTIVDDDT